MRAEALGSKPQMQGWWAENPQMKSTLIFSPSGKGKRAASPLLTHPVSGTLKPQIQSVHSFPLPASSLLTHPASGSLKPQMQCASLFPFQRAGRGKCHGSSWRLLPCTANKTGSMGGGDGFTPPSHHWGGWGYHGGVLPTHTPMWLHPCAQSGHTLGFESGYVWHGKDWKVPIPSVPVSRRQNFQEPYFIVDIQKIARCF